MHTLNYVLFHIVSRKAPHLNLGYREWMFIDYDDGSQTKKWTDGTRRLGLLAPIILLS